MAGRSILGTLINGLPNPVLMTIGSYQLKSLHIALVVLVSLAYFTVKKLNSKTGSTGDESNPAGAIVLIFIPLVLVLIILVTAFGRH